jgi:hypothetical protein
MATTFYGPNLANIHNTYSVGSPALPLQNAATERQAPFIHSHGVTAYDTRHLNWALSGQLTFGQFPRKIAPGMHIPQRKRKTAKGKSVCCAKAHTGLDYSIVNMRSAIFPPPNTHLQQHFAKSFNAFRYTFSDVQDITLFFLRVPSPKLCRGACLWTMNPGQWGSSCTQLAARTGSIDRQDLVRCYTGAIQDRDIRHRGATRPLHSIETRARSQLGSSMGAILRAISF